MKKNTLLLLILVVIASLVILGLNFTVQAQPQEKMKDVKFPMPDLIITQFDVNQNSIQRTGTEVSFSFTAVIKNIGDADVNEKFYVTIKKYREDVNSWGLTALSTSKNCFLINPPLRAQQTGTIRGRFFLSEFELPSNDIRLIALADSACNETLPPTRCHVDELHEDNNYSNDVTVSAGYYPNIAGINPTTCAAEIDEITIAGLAFGNTQGTHTVKLRQSDFQIAANIKQWDSKIIIFTVPFGAKLGNNKVSIADSNTLQSLSNEVDLQVYPIRR